MRTPRRPGVYGRLSITVSINRRGKALARTAVHEPRGRSIPIFRALALAGTCCIAIAVTIWPTLTAPISVSLMAPPCVLASMQLFHQRRYGKTAPGSKHSVIQTLSREFPEQLTVSREGAVRRRIVGRRTSWASARS